ncbi:fatty acid metabolism transcriptional regulator FadR [Bisgaard Taxon 10/6]|uniref:Fatty acid metabolism regulator protein n=1 Tax=Exercitatus varius TaxID=67857 RepID=A0ABT6EN89_9PAST|nr:fatty acid metabolism transcriptional regulator FadR [Exercitatus varius]MDG2939413.1 fatty acid metabolism transcriptional regulator FadR [Exercitatus varius]MDG2944997.1 fatty acid metabolism transcriptional regulator FadR [Exercitatus varius]
MNDFASILKARSPAALAEEYIIKSIWNNTFPPGTDLPAERDLAEKIGVTRTTLREVLQRLARDGWLHIQHGKPTRVNNVWETSGLNIIEVLIRLDSVQSPLLIANVLSARTNLATIYMPRAFKYFPAESFALFDKLDSLEDTAEAYIAFDYKVYRDLTFISKNPIYGLVLNSLRNLYMRVGTLYFSNAKARTLAMKFYKELVALAKTEQFEVIPALIRQYGKESGVLYAEIQDDMTLLMNK